MYSAYEDTDGIMAYYREDENKRVLVVANLAVKRHKSGWMAV